MTSDDFGTWWPCLRKHYKRTKVWLPRIKMLDEALGGERSLRYFTLCARPMIDVYMLVRERVLLLDTASRRIKNVSFCECDEVIFPEMKELIGIEESGFLARLEKLVLFQDIPETDTLDTLEALSAFIEEVGEGVSDDVRDAVEEKRKLIQLQKAFPFDFLNLDFCDRYYGDPPDVMIIHRTIEKLLEWQRRPLALVHGSPSSVSRFVLAITCRVNAGLSPVVTKRLKNIVDENAREHVSYRDALTTRAISDLSRWAQDDPLDFFMSAWPKEIAKLAEAKEWNITIHDHAFYDRQRRNGETYHMVCLVVEFKRTSVCTTYLQAVTEALDKDTRTQITRFDPPLNREGRTLLADLRKIVELRNEQARAFNRKPLPDPETEMTQLRSQGVRI